MSLHKIPIKAIAVFDGKINGIVYFEEDFNENCIIINIHLQGFKKKSIHGFHVHQAGDLTDKCESMCAHFNPYNKKHGCPGIKERHVGDLGNIIANDKGEVNLIIKDNYIKLRGSIANIIGRGLIIHADKDDCGKGSNDASLINGNAGKRIACAIIGYAKENYQVKS